MHAPVAYAWVVMAIFAFGAVAFTAVGVYAPALRRKLWTLWALEALQISAVLIPAALGAPAREAVYLALAALCIREVDACASKAHASRTRWVAAVVLGFVATWWVAAQGFALFALGYAVIEINDTAAWAIGSALGRHKLAPSISPNKTWEGLCAGWISSIALAQVLAFLVPDWSRSELVLAAVVVAFAGTAGDLAASALKRRAGARHYGTVFPHQGGVFDLYDSLVFAAPVWCAFLWARDASVLLARGASIVWARGASL